MNLLKVVFIIVLFLFPLGEIARYEFGNGIAVTINDIAVSFFVVIYVIILSLKRQRITKDHLKKYIPFFLFPAFGLLFLLIQSSNLSHFEFFVSFLYLLRWIMYFALFFAVKEFDEPFKKTIQKVMILVGAVIVIGGYIQYLWYPNLRNLYYLGWDEHLYRMFSGFLDPNFAGTFFVLYLLFVTHIFIEGLQKRTLIKSILLGSLICLILGALLLTYSRSALLMCVIVVPLFFVLQGKKKLIIGFIALFIFFIFISPKAFQTEGTNILRTTSSFARVVSFQNAFTIFKENPIFGVGFNAYRYAQKEKGYLVEREGDISHSGGGADNSFLFVLATTGIVGFVSYLYLLKTVIKGSLKTKHFALVLSSFIGLFIASCFINALFYPFLMEWMWILSGLQAPKEKK